MIDMLQVLTMMTVPAAALFAIRCLNKRQDRRAAAQSEDI